MGEKVEQIKDQDFAILYADFDTILLKHPAVELEKLGASKHLLVGGSVYDDCINSGLLWFPFRGAKGKEPSSPLIPFLHLALLYLFENPYTVDQRVLSYFLGTNAGGTARPESLP